MSLAEAQQLAQERGLDVVEVAPQAQPPVCRLMDYGRFKFEALKHEKKSSEQRKRQKIVEIKEIKLRPGIDDHDYEVKMRSVRRFFEEGDKVKLTIMFRGRELVHQEIGRALLDRLADEVKDVAQIERSPLVEGRNMIMILNPVSKKQSKGGAGNHAKDPHPQGNPEAVPAVGDG